MPLEFGRELGVTRESVRANIERRVEVHSQLIRECLEARASGADAIISAYRDCEKTRIFGNGASAADTRHLALEFVGRDSRFFQSHPATASVFA